MRTFWIAVGVAILLVVIGVAVGAGVGGSQAAKHSKEAKEAAAARFVYSIIINSGSLAPDSVPHRLHLYGFLRLIFISR